MKNFRYLVAIVPLFFLFSCVSSKKYKELDAEFKNVRSTERNCQTELVKAQAANKVLQDQLDDLKKNNNKALNMLQDLSVISGQQAENIKKSLENLSQKDSYIMNLQSEIARKDSLNMQLVMNLKSSLVDVNDQDINVKVDKGVVFIDISDKLLFNSGKYKVTDKAQEVLGKVARVLNAHPDCEFMVEGHTDSIPIHTNVLDDNWDLSVKRATAIVRILQDKYQIDPARMTAAGHSKYRPIASNATAEGRAINRRTRIVILPQLDQFFNLMESKEMK
jgi:chemotaxis protein MotB